MNRASLCGAGVVLLVVLTIPHFVHCGLVDMSHVLGNDTVYIPEFSGQSGIKFVIEHRGYWTSTLPDTW